MLVDVALHFHSHEPTGFVGLVLPGEYAGGHDPIEADLSERAEKVVPGHFALADVEMLMNARSRAGRIENVAQARGGAMIEGVADMHMREHVAALPKHRFGVISEIERVWCAVEKLDVP